MSAAQTVEPVINLYIYFTGLIVFAEERPRKTPATALASRIGDRGKPPAPRVRALVVDVRNPSALLQKEGRRCDTENPVIPHVPVVQFLWRYLSESGKQEGCFRPLPPLKDEGSDGEGVLRSAVAKSTLYQALRLPSSSAQFSQPGQPKLDNGGSGRQAVREDSDPPRRGFWFLEKEILQLDPEMATEETELIVNRSVMPADFIVPGKSDMLSINWVAPMRGKGDKEPRLKKGITDPLNSPEAQERLAATFLLDRGCLRPAAFASELGHFVTFDSAGETQAQVSVLELKVRVRDRKVRIISTRFDGSPGRTLELEIPEEDIKTLEPDTEGGREGTKRIEVWLLNREWTAIRDQTPARAVDYEEINPEYLFLYDLITDDTRPGEEKFPVAIQRCRAREGDDTTPPGCWPCDDPAMKRVYFITGDYGEAALSAPCSPAYIKEEQE